MLEARLLFAVVVTQDGVKSSPDKICKNFATIEHNSFVIGYRQSHVASKHFALVRTLLSGWMDTSIQRDASLTTVEALLRS